MCGSGVAENNLGVRENGDALMGEGEEGNGVEVMEEAVVENQGECLSYGARECGCCLHGNHLATALAHFVRPWTHSQYHMVFLAIVLMCV